MTVPPVVIVGAGLAGLNCAAELSQRGIATRIFEAADGIGGRARTDSLEGFRLDRGFQVLLTDYPEAQRTFDYEALRLGEFMPGARIRRGGKFSTLADPSRVPRAAVAGLNSPAAELKDLWKLYRMKRDLTRTEPREILERPDLPAIESLRQRGFSTRVIESFFRPFFGGVFIDPDLTTSSRLLEIYFRCFSRGAAALPEGGIGGLADQLASRLPENSIQLGSKVTMVDAEGIELEDGKRVEAGAVVVAADETGASSLCDFDPPPPDPVESSTACIYFDVPEAEFSSPWLFLSPAGEGPVNELAVPSSIAGGYAPAGRSLVSVSVVGEACARPNLLEKVTAQLGEWFGGTTVNRWRHLRTYQIKPALPPFRPGRLIRAGQRPRLDTGVYICGDHRETPSIQGALVSGRKAAAAVTADQRSRPAV